MSVALNKALNDKIRRENGRSALGVDWCWRG